MTETPHRQFLTSPGDTLLLTPTAFEAEDRRIQFEEATGLGAYDTVASLLCAVPIPIYPQTPEGERHRFPGVPPTMMWHPLFWLPLRVGALVRLKNADGTTYQEDPDVHAARVAMELMMSGLYHSDLGWLDVLASVGINIDDPAQQNRVRAWQLGGVDPVLDSIDLTDALTVHENPWWALHFARETQSMLMGAQHFRIAASLIAVLDEDAETPEASAEDLNLVAQLASTYLADVETADGSDANDFWDRVSSAATHPSFRADKASLQEGPGASARQWLSSVAAATNADARELSDLLSDTEA